MAARRGLPAGQVRGSAALVQFDIFVAVSDSGEVTLELLARYYHRGAVVVGVETERRASAEIFVEKQMDMVLLVVDQTERRDRPRQQPEVALHALLRGERQFALMQTVLEIVYGHIARRVEADQIVTVALVIPEKQIFAVRRAVIAPILPRDVDRGCFGVFVPLVAYREGVEIIEYFLSSFHGVSLYVLFRSASGYVSERKVSIFRLIRCCLPVFPAGKSIRLTAECSASETCGKQWKYVRLL